MTIENNKKLLDYAKYLWLKEKKFIPFPYILLNSSILLNKCYDTIFPLLNKESLKINFFLLKNYVAKYQQHPVLRIWGDGMNIGGLNKVLSKSTEEQSGVMISKEGMRRSDKFLQLSALIMQKNLLENNMESFLFREGADEIGGIVTEGNFAIIQDIINKTNAEIHEKAQCLKIDSIPHSKYEGRYGSMFICDYAPVDKKMYQDKIIEDKVKILSKQFNNQNPECINYDDNFIYSYEQNINKLLSEYQSKIELVSYKNNDIELFKKFMVNTFGSDIKTSEMLQNDLLALENISNKFVVVLQQNNMKGVNDMYGHTKADRIHNLLTAKILMEMKALTNADGYKLCSEYASTSNKILIIFDAKNEKNANDILSQALKSTDNFIQHLGLKNLKHPHNSKKDGVFFIYHLEKLKCHFMSNREIEKYKSDLTKNLMIKEDSNFIIPFNLNRGKNK